MIRLSPYIVPNFLTPMGAWAKMRALEKRGFPQNLRNWRFITLTMDRSRYPDPEQAYEVGKRHLRQFIYELRKEYSITRWCWKLELHKPDGEGRRFPHWHLLIDYKRPIAVEDVHTRWGKGRTEIQAVRNQGFDYLFKYVAKSVSDLPDWITNRTCLRLFQTSRNFFPASGVVDDESEASPRLSAEEPGANTENDALKSETIGERLDRWTKLVVSRIQTSEGGIRHQLHVMKDSWGSLRAHVCSLKFTHNLSEQKMRINSYSIETTCLRMLQSYLPA